MYQKRLIGIILIIHENNLSKHRIFTFFRSLEHAPDRIVSPDRRLIQNLQSPSPGK